MFSRELKKGSPELLILALLEEGDRHGYEIGKLIETRSHGRLQFRIGSLYPVLCRLEAKALIKGRWVEHGGGPRRRYYKLTAKGRTFLKNERDTWEAYVAAINQIIGEGHA
jgi:DNA-binding PadR family transcriptional regulator